VNTNLTNANLTGAILQQAFIAEVIYQNTRLPNGSVRN